MFHIKNRMTNDSYSRSKYLRLLFAENKHKQMSFGGKFKIYTVPSNYFFQRLLRFSFERMIYLTTSTNKKKKYLGNSYF
jgi:hypothetical protein